MHLRTIAHVARYRDAVLPGHPQHRAAIVFLDALLSGPQQPKKQTHGARVSGSCPLPRATRSVLAVRGRAWTYAKPPASELPARTGRYDTCACRSPAPHCRGHSPMPALLLRAFFLKSASRRAPPRLAAVRGATPKYCAVAAHGNTRLPASSRSGVSPSPVCSLPLPLRGAGDTWHSHPRTKIT